MIRMKKIPTTRGAAMGRMSYNDFRSIPPDPDMPEIPNVKATLNKVAMTRDGAYDTGGAYWGLGETLWVAERTYYEKSTDKYYEAREFVRASSREQAKYKINSINGWKCVEFFK